MHDFKTQQEIIHSKKAIQQKLLNRFGFCDNKKL
jgi:hypothetical protein